MTMPHPFGRVSAISLFLAAVLACKTFADNGSAPAAAVNAPAQDAHLVTVDAASVIRSLLPRPVGINMNFLRDDDRNLPGGSRPISAALSDLGVHFLRYPGGEKADWQFWSTAPWTHANPTLFGWYKDAAWNVLDFDRFMANIAGSGMEPYIVAGYDSQSRTGVTLSYYLKTAVEWVRYANVVKHYHIKYWEIGNENWHNSTGTPEQMAAVVSQFSRAMKAVDPTIKIGASGDNDDWWRRFLPLVGADLDFLVISNYPSIRSLDAYTTSGPGALSRVQAAAAAISKYAAPADQSRLSVIAAEFNAVDWFNHWPDTNDVGHALVAFDMFGQMAMEPKLTAAMYWNTHWLDVDSAYSSLFFALDKNNNLTAQGQAVKLWGQFMLDEMVKVTTTDQMITAYATTSTDQKCQSVFLVNKGPTALELTVNCDNLGFVPGQADAWLFAGTSASDRHPKLTQMAGVTFNTNMAQVQLPPYSITVLDLHAPAAASPAPAAE